MAKPVKKILDRRSTSAQKLKYQKPGLREREDLEDLSVDGEIMSGYLAQGREKRATC
jgi:hypothetical protein